MRADLVQDECGPADQGRRARPQQWRLADVAQREGAGDDQAARVDAPRREHGALGEEHVRLTPVVGFTTRTGAGTLDGLRFGRGDRIGVVIAEMRAHVVGDGGDLLVDSLT